MDDGDDLEDILRPPEKVIQLPGRQTRSTFERTDSDLCLSCQSKKRDRRDRRRFEDLVRCEGDSTPATLVSAEARRDERFLLEVRDQYLWAKYVLYNRSDSSSYTSSSTLKRPCMKYKYVKLNVMMEEWKRWDLKEASRAVYDILLGGCL